MTITQTQRVLRALRENPQVGITQADFLPPDVCDGGAKITRVGARIMELKDDGHRIRTVGKRDGFAVYLLEDPTSPSALEPPTPVRLQGALVGAGAPRNAIYGTD